MFFRAPSEGGLAPSAYCSLWKVPVKAIFYDLETTDREFVGQILNYSFILVDEQLNVVRELNGDIRISRLQLPSRGGKRAGAAVAAGGCCTSGDHTRT